MRQPRHVQRLRAPRGGVRAGRGGARRMSASASLMGFARSSSKHGAVHLDSGHHRAQPRDRAARAGDGHLRLGVDRRPGERAAVLLPRAAALADADRRRLCGAACSRCRPSSWSAPRCRCSRVAIALLVMVLVPGLGHSVNGSRRWLRLAGANFQVSELARVLVLIYIASYAVRREAELRESFIGLLKPLGLLFGVSAAAAARAGLRRRDGAVRHRLRPAVPRRRTAALRDRR